MLTTSLSPTAPVRSWNFLPRLAMAIALVAVAMLAAPGAEAAEPLRLHPDNPRYLEFRGKPTVLITSAEHYGAVLNLDFDYVPYLDELQAHGLNLTRTFTGAYCEPVGAFNITGNTLAPAKDRLICPWQRSTAAGYANGGNKFDLTKWDEDYFRRLKDFVAQAGKREIVVELVLFCPFYEDSMWNLSPQKASNNINGVGQMPRTEVYTLKHRELLAVHDAMVQKIVRELNEFDNVYYEICNEPYFGGVTREWQHHIADTIVQTERELPRRHLIAQNIANGSAKIVDPHPAVSIFNFHYATPPVCVRENAGLNKVIGDDETGFKGSDDVTYRREGWEFMLAGGGIFSNLDYSFTPEHEAGTARPQAPGGGGSDLRRQLGILKNFLHGFDLIRMKPDNGVIQGGVPQGARAWALAEAGRAYAIYLHSGKQATLSLRLPAGTYRAEWLHPQTGKIDAREQVTHEGGERDFKSPAYAEDIALRIVRADNQPR